jgi:hypothetical protein
MGGVDQGWSRQSNSPLPLHAMLSCSWIALGVFGVLPVVVVPWVIVTVPILLSVLFIKFLIEFLDFWPKLALSSSCLLSLLTKYLLPPVDIQTALGIPSHYKSLS